jgi:transcriptional regulator with XRE-family HTH domain
MAVHIANGTTMNSHDEKFFKDLGLRIASARKAQNLTQQQLADRLGIAQQTYAQYETGRARIQAAMLPKLAQDLCLTMDELMGLAGTRSKPGPASKLDMQIERLRQLPKAKQRLLMAMLDAAIMQASH